MNITIEGVIGVGKSTLISNLSKELPDYHIIHEPVAENPYLEPYYRFPSQFSLPLQIEFLSTRIEQYKHHLWQGHKVITDRGIYGDLAFSKTIFRMGLIGVRENDTYNRFFSLMMDSYKIKPVDTIVYLRAKPDIVWERIKQRNRGIETGLDRAYFDVLCYEYDKAMKETGTRVITVDWNTFKPTQEIISQIFL